MKPHRPLRHREDGMALFVAILLLLVVTVMGIALMFTATFEQTLTGVENRISKIFYAADSGIEYGAGMLSSQISYTGGPMPVGVSSFYPGLPAPDMAVTISSPILLGFTIPEGYERATEGSGQPQFVENLYFLTSSARSTKIEASKTIEAEVGIAPKLQTIPE